MVQNLMIPPQRNVSIGPALFFVLVWFCVRRVFCQVDWCMDSRATSRTFCDFKQFVNCCWLRPDATGSNNVTANPPALPVPLSSLPMAQRPDAVDLHLGVMVEVWCRRGWHFIPAAVVARNHR